MAAFTIPALNYNSIAASSKSLGLINTFVNYTCICQLPPDFPHNRLCWQGRNSPFLAAHWCVTVGYLIQLLTFHVEYACRNGICLTKFYFWECNHIQVHTSWTCDKTGCPNHTERRHSRLYLTWKTHKCLICSMHLDFWECNHIFEVSKVLIKLVVKVREQARKSNC